MLKQVRVTDFIDDLINSEIPFIYKYLHLLHTHVDKPQHDTCTELNQILITILAINSVIIDTPRITTDWSTNNLSR